VTCANTLIRVQNPPSAAEARDEVAVDEQQDAAARRLAELLSPAAIDSLIADAEA
jgi:hypothetical protein